ncbi:AIR synthase related protein [Flavisolibacter ginsengisoli]|jgi:phosphoribosylformylglycinamidine cyclo-ligase|uniref:Phosphoribosylformylglycinamidine cyclo-ligase n=1 Tax=Flavisolibacter ginsengisoli DSM 18119 TaxID=1121884 RepID=A0A1M5BLW8_9BACT|nr:AIR synthase related protein [Flavisolibacter ginsengisoli]SHF43498.1 phosphoribosylformylglycinamidine cyclo-ligase [Flavisolibacter ginsengisoli DSM 18119]
MSLYSKRGVSAQKEEVHAATRNIDKGLYPKAFCKIYKDLLGNDENWINVMHADGAGTKSILAYLYWKETGDVSVWKGIAQDAIVMNLDDLLCVGIYDKILFSSSIDRNKHLLPGEVLKTLIEGTQAFLDTMRDFDVDIAFLGGETADVGDVVRTIAVNGTMAARWPKDKLVTNEKIARGNVIVGLASYGRSTYENEYNSGIGSNGLTSARHDVLNKFYAENFPETFEPSLNSDVVYIGQHKLLDPITVSFREERYETNIGKLILSPTRTFAPVVKTILEEHFDDINGLIHCSGGGQTKCMKYVPDNVNIVKDNLIAAPEIFNIIQQASGADEKEMYQVFNMGCRLEIYTNEETAGQLINIANEFGIDAQVIGRVEEGNKELEIITGDKKINYNF